MRVNDKLLPLRCHDYDLIRHVFMFITLNFINRIALISYLRLAHTVGNSSITSLNMVSALIQTQSGIVK